MKYFAALIIMVALTKLFAQDRPDTNQITYRPATVAGTFYPQNRDTLKKWISDYLHSDEDKKISGDIIAICVPHAGYVYSGWVAGLAYRELIGRKYDAIFIIAPSHSESFSGASVFKGEAYTTPLGEALVDLELSKDISNQFPEIKFSLNGHKSNGERSEHSIEVQIPFLQIVQPSTPIVPIVMGQQDFSTIDLLTKAIVTAVKKSNKKVLIVASSDLSHFYNQSKAEATDLPLVKAFSKFDYYKLNMNLYYRKYEACGGGPLIVAMMAAEQLGANTTYSFTYATSANSPFVKANPERVVGYFSGAVFDDKSGKLNLLPGLNDVDKKQIMEIARLSVKHSVEGKTLIDSNESFSESLNDEYAAFVTLKKKGKLRGCMGHTFASEPMWESIAEAGKLAAVRDPRFSPVSKSELKDLEYEVTVLSRMKKIMSIEEIEIGRDGVYIRLDGSSAIFLPQVAPEQGWNRKEMLEQLCLKAGLSKNAYLKSDADVYIFQAMIIH